MRFPTKIFQIETFIFVAILVGIVTTVVFLIYEYEENRHTLVYLYKESDNSSADDLYIEYVYGIQSFELQDMEYSAKILVDGSIVKEEVIILAPKETFEKRDVIDLTGTTRNPIKVELQVTSPLNTYQVHFWVDSPS